MGMAVSVALQRVVTSNAVDNTLSVYQLAPPPYGPAGTPPATLRLIGVLGGPSAPPAMRFAFNCGGGASGFLCFSVPTDGTGPLLLVADAGNDAVHFVDVISGTHQGHLCSKELPGTLPGPRAVAASAKFIAVR
jgi:hypothetical protein